ncbi:MAG TPA: phage holin family protein [Mycobacteriales bacterium]|nr:phage holin family protein [Mycobacteriales bacterium]
MEERVTGSYAAGQPGYRDGHPDVEDRSVGELLGKVTTDLSTLMRKEVELAKVEMKEEATKAGKAGGMLAGAGAVGYLVLVFLALALMFALDAVMPTGWAALITAAVLGVIAAILFVVGKKQFAQVNPKPEQTVETLKEDVQWAKNRNS